MQTALSLSQFFFLLLAQDDVTKEGFPKYGLLRSTHLCLRGLAHSVLVCLFGFFYSPYRCMRYSHFTEQFKDIIKSPRFPIIHAHD